MKGRAGLCGFCFSAVISVVTEYTDASHPQSVSLFPEMFAFHFPAGCLVLSVNFLELEAAEQQVVNDILQHIESFLRGLGDNSVVKAKWIEELSDLSADPRPKTSSVQQRLVSS